MASSAFGGVAASTRCRSRAPSSSTNSAAAECSRIRRSGPSCSYTAACTSGCGNPTSRIPNSSRTCSSPTTEASSNAVNRSDTPASVAAAATGAVLPSTATASTKLLVGRSAASRRRNTWAAKARGAGNDGFQVRHRFSGSSASIVVTYRALPPVWACSRCAARLEKPRTPRAVASCCTSDAGSGGRATVAPVRPPASRRRPSGSRCSSSVRWPSTTSTRSSTSRRQANSSARNESMSAQWASSTTTATGAFSSSSVSTSKIQAPTPTGSSGGKERSRLSSSRAVLIPATRMIWSTTP